ncbi:MAG: hypothetical protein FJX80_02945 [Bacteroidetes bacterium]|nr:hypothetical protein [Bacteroidota bacterium]
MEKVIDEGCTHSDFVLNVKKNTIRFKAGSELSSSVNRMDVDLVEEIRDTHHFLDISILFGTKKYPKIDTIVKSN